MNEKLKEALEALTRRCAQYGMVDKMVGGIHNLKHQDIGRELNLLQKYITKSQEALVDISLKEYFEQIKVVEPGENKQK